MANLFSRMANSIQESWDNFTLGSDRAKVAAINRAIAYIKSQGKTSLGSSKVEQIVKFLVSRRRVEAANKLVDAYGTRKIVVVRGEQDYPYEINSFLDTLCSVVAPEVYKIPVPQEGVKSEELYKDLGIVGQAAIMREFKNLLNQAVIEMTDGKRRLTSTQLDLPQGSHLSLDSEDFSERLKQKANAARAEGSSFFSLYESSVNWSSQEADIKKNSRVRTVKNVLFYTLMVICTLIGIGEGSAPASFYLTKMGLAGLTGPFAMAIAAVVFVAAASVNTLLFHGDSYSTFKDLFIKNRFLFGSNGKRLPWYLILRNCTAFVLAFFSGLTIAGLSFYFSLFPAVALYISAMTLIGYTGVLTYGVMQILDVSSVFKFGNYLHGLLVRPMQTIGKNANGATKAKAIGLTIVNAFVVTAMFTLSATVVVATFLMFNSALLGIPFFAANFGTAGVLAIVAVAEVALGTFFSRNVFRCLEAIRGTVTDIFGLNTKITTSEQAAVILKTQEDIAKNDHPVRNGLVLTSNILLAVFVGFALINASGFALGYIALGMTTGAAIFPKSFADLVNRALVFAKTSFESVVGYLFGTAYVGASTGGNVGAAAKAVAVPEALLVYPVRTLETTKVIEDPKVVKFDHVKQSVRVFRQPDGIKCFIAKYPALIDDDAFVDRLFDRELGDSATSATPAP